MVRVPVSLLFFTRHFPPKPYKFYPSTRIIHDSIFSGTPQLSNFTSYRDPFVSSLINALKSSSSVGPCQAVHARVIKSLHFSDGFIGDQLVSAYLDMGFTEDAHKLFDEMPSKDLVSWNSLISGFSRRGHLSKSLAMFFRMKYEAAISPNELTLISMIASCSALKALDEGKYMHAFAMKLGLLLEAKVSNSLLSMYGKSGYLECAVRLFWAMPERNVVSWNSLVALYSQKGLQEEAFRYFNMMRMFKFSPDEATTVALLQACEESGLGVLAEAIHGLILIYGLIGNITIATTLLNLYAKLGRLNASCKVFEEIRKPDKVAQTAMLASYAIHGHGKEAVKLFKELLGEGLEPDHVTFTHLLSACSHSGLVEEGKLYFRAMSDVYRVEPRLDHYSCMADLLGRSGLLDDAYELIKHMPMEPSSGVWGALLGACRVYGNVELGKEAAEKLIALEPLDPRTYILLSNIYSAAGLWGDASKARAFMKDQSLTKSPGCSYIEHGKKIHRFVVDDHSHPDSDRIHRKLEELILKIRRAGFVSKTEPVLHDVDEGVKLDMINKHSEKIAIAYGLLVTNPGVPLVIIKNLRICDDCHNTAKFVSWIENHKIIIRDSKRFHHFSNGLCSCGDYW